MTPALLFALVDAVLENAAIIEFFTCPCECWNPELCPECYGGALRLGAWRSLWPLGGGE